MVTLETLYNDYLRELENYAPEPFTETADEIIQKYKRNRCNDIRIIFHEGSPAGFLIIGKHPNCHPDCNYFICQSYIAPEYRKKGLMTKALADFEKDHKGRYCLDVLFKNFYARMFWFKRFKELGYVDITLPFIEHGVTGICDTLFFEPSIHKRK